MAEAYVKLHKQSEQTKPVKSGKKSPKKPIEEPPVEEVSSEEEFVKISKEDEDQKGLVYLEDGSKEWYVEKIVDKKFFGDILYYRVKWLGWKSRYNTWEPVKHLEHCRKEIKLYEKRLVERIKNGEVKLPTTPEASTSKDTLSGSGLGEEEELEEDVQKSEEKKADDSDCEFDEEGLFVIEPEAIHETPFAEVVDDEVEEEDETQKRLDKNFWGEWYGNHRALKWIPTEVPVAILGSAVRGDTVLHMVRIRRIAEGEDPRRYKKVDDPYEGLDDDNTIIVTNELLAHAFPKLLAEYFRVEGEAQWVENAKSGKELAAEAARQAKIHNLKTAGVELDYEDMQNKLMPPGVVTEEGPSSSNSVFKKPLPVKSPKKPKDKPEIDAFGLPEEYCSDDEEHVFGSDSDSSDSDDFLEQ